MISSLRPARFRFASALLWCCLLLGAVAAPGTSARAQSTAGFGDWQLHLPANRVRALADAGDRVYVAAEDAFFYFDKELNTTRLLSRRDGLSDVRVNTVAYDSVSRQVLVAYRSANIDVLRPDGTIQNVSDIARKQISGDKIINTIYVSGKLAYLSCSFGLVVFDLVKLEIRDTYSNIGPGGTAVQVFSTTVLRDSLYAATSAGLMRGRIGTGGDNLVDYRKWTIDQPGAPGNPYQTLATQDGKVYAGKTFGNLLRFGGTGRGWQPIFSIYADLYQQLTPSRAGLLLATRQSAPANAKVLIYNPRTGAVTPLRSPLLVQPQAVLRSRNGDIYIGDFENGLVRTTDRMQFENFLTNGPAEARAFSVLADAATNTVTVFTGGHQDNYVQNDYFGGFYEYKEGRWTNITNKTIPDLTQFPNTKDLTRGARTADGTLYIGSYGNGVLKWEGPGKFQAFGVTNSTLRSALPVTDPNYQKFVRVTDLAVDADGKLWVVNRHQLPQTSGLHVYDPVSGNWAAIRHFPGSENLDRIALDDFGNPWVTEARRLGNGLTFYDKESLGVRKFTEADGLPAGDVYDIVRDRKGEIWVGTSKGVAYFADPSLALPQGGPPSTFSTPTVMYGLSKGFPALRDEVVRAVAVDGSNRKWFGTDRGLWYFSEDADEGLLHFTTENSPLPSNRIVDVAVNDKTGEVFVVTDAGVVAYRGTATVTEGKPDCARVSPNPVRTNFAGVVGITGLANNGFVKITDITGKLVYQTRASGGGVTWNLADYNGRKVQSGVYLVLSSDADGKNGCISKIAVVAE
ncbi:T9SS type A sorting domain-containing protein [Hymenobacter sp. BT175]|uniref:type IX secretion system anionic LPS delivery protein PorZ n=1 Tax=Hymenobacter translucens TaxID=2886507 RepID=UPI001D0E5319|nr:T9SS type A sorting domain-containing protein [Hymenobacter translucens]MCC2547529.1 T9SS type A sorting domain-containing protein [Hymenobacter translucens]